MPHTHHITASSAISRIADGGMAVYNSFTDNKDFIAGQ